MVLEQFFQAKSIAVIGASREEGKVGNVIFQNLIYGGYKGEVYPINPNAEVILGLKAYRSVLDIKEKIEMAVIAVPALYVPKVLDECGKKGIKTAIIISSGFKETGNTKLEQELEIRLKKHKIQALGPNCLGIYDSETKLDTLFLPKKKLKRPKQGAIAFATQSGALGSALFDLAAEEGFGFSKFISYGNALNIDESDFLAFLDKDEKTKLICLYIEGLHNGKKFFETMKKMTKPVIVLKGGMTTEGGHATLSHTGSLAGAPEVYEGVFRQTKALHAQTMQEVFDLMKIFEKLHAKPGGKRIQIITNGGGFGIVTTDAVKKEGLELAELSKPAVKELCKKFPTIIAKNPIDLLGDATPEKYQEALRISLKEKNTDAIILIVLTQVPLLNENVLNMIIELNREAKKPIIAITTGSEYTRNWKTKLEEGGVPVFDFPENAVHAFKRYLEYYEIKK